MGGARPNESFGVKPPAIGPLIIAATLAMNLLALVLPVVLLQVFDRIVPYQSFDTMTVLLCMMIIALCLDFALRYARVVVLGQAASVYEMRLDHAALRKVLATDSYAFRTDTFGTHIDRLAAIPQLRDYYGGQGRLSRIDLPFTAIFVLMIWYIGGWLVAVPLGCIALLLLASVSIRRNQEQTLAERHSVDRRRYSFLSEVLGQVATVKALSAEEQMRRRFELLQDQSAASSAALIRVASVSQSLCAIIGQVAVIALGALGGWLAMTGAIGMAELAACMLLNGRTIQPMLRLLGIWVEMEGYHSARHRLAEIEALPNAPSVAQHADAFEPSLHFEGVGLHPKGRAEPVFSNLSFSVEPGQIALISGYDGSGRSSIMRMILGEQVPTTGTVEIGGHDPLALRNRRGIGELAYVDQEPAIFSGTILENLALCGDRAAQDSAIEAAERIGLAEDIFALPFGFDTIIGSGSSSFLPTGTLQKIAIARALSFHPSILLFNNAASAIDGDARRTLAETLRALRGQTTIVAASGKLLKPDDADVRITLGATREPGMSPELARWIRASEDGAAAPMALRLRRAGAVAAS